MDTDQPLVILLSSDLMWMSRFLATAQALGVRLLAARDLARLREHLEQAAPACVIVELGEVAIAQVAAAVKENRPEATLVPYGSHVDLDSFAAARAAGFSPVLAKSQMAEELAARLPAWAGK